MTIDAQSLSVIVSVNSTSDGTISIQLPRSLIDAKTGSGQDDAFIVLIDGAEVKPQSESSDNNFRNITIQFLQGDQDIELIGTQIVPEFGPIAALVLAIAIISIIAVSAKTGLRFIPKY
jgi:predicted secreted protein with PEFG-CTERM motif